MDLYQADRLREELDRSQSSARVVVSADLWDQPPDFQTAILPAARGGERSLKLDMVEQAFHVLRPRGILIVLSDYGGDQFFPNQLKKVFGRIHAPQAGRGSVLWSRRQGDRPRRRHEITFHVQRPDAPSLVFLSRPGTFAYGRFDDGARALVETMEVHAGDRILDLGCGCGTNGICAGLQTGPTGCVTFVDSNVRAIALAEHNARANGLNEFQAIATAALEGLAPESFDVILANPPYYAQGSIAEMFIRRARPLLRPGGRFYLVTKQPDVVGTFLVELFEQVEGVLRRGYTVLQARATS